MTILESVKKACRITVDAYDDELRDAIEAAGRDLGIAGVRHDAGVSDPLIRRAVITFCSLNFAGGDYDRLKKSYDEQKAQLQMATDYTNWGDSE